MNEFFEYHVPLSSGPRLALYEDPHGLWRWRLVADKTVLPVLAESVRGFMDKEDCLENMRRTAEALLRALRARAKSADVIELTQITGGRDGGKNRVQEEKGRVRGARPASGSSGQE